MVVTPVTSSCTSGNTCYNSYGSLGFSIEAQVLHAIEDSEIELSPAEIARKIHAPNKPTQGQYTTVRVFCRRLLEKGQIRQPYPGAYCSKITHGVRFEPLSVHNITLRSFVCQDIAHWEKDEVVGGVKIHVCFGSERRKVTGYIACDVGGMSHDACLLALNRWFDLVSSRLGFQLNDLEILTFECNKDYHGIRIDGAQCITRTGLCGMIDRIYQKEDAMVRAECKVITPVSVNKFEHAIGNFEGFQSAQQLYEIKREVRLNTEAVKFNNSRLLEVIQQNNALFAEFIRLKEGSGKLGSTADPLLSKDDPGSGSYVR